MGIHTFNTLVLRNRPPQWLGSAVTSIGWTSALVIGRSKYILVFFYVQDPLPGIAPVLISGGANGPLYNIDNFTCDISKSYEVVHMFLYFLPVRFLCPGRFVMSLYVPKVLPCVAPLSDHLLPHLFGAPRHPRYQRWPENPN